MQITQGPLPNDLELVDPATFLEAWIAGTTITGLDVSQFQGSSLQVVYSQTEAPASYLRVPGVLWYARGNGRLFMWDKPDLPSGLTFSDAGWIALSERRELWLYSAGANIPLGAPCQCVDTTATINTDYLTRAITEGTQYQDDTVPRPIWFVHSHSNNSGISDQISDLVFVALESASSGTIFRACDLGFCTVLCASGESGNAGSMVLDEIKPGVWRRIDETMGSHCKFMPIAQTIDSTATNPGTEWLRTAFKHAAPIIGIGATV